MCMYVCTYILNVYIILCTYLWFPAHIYYLQYAHSHNNTSFLCSSEDIDTKAQVNSWLKVRSRGAEVPPQLEGWIEDFFYRSLSLASSLGQSVQTTVTGLMVNGLTHVCGAVTKEDFACRLVRGLGGNMSQSKKQELAKQVFHWTNTVLPDTRKPLSTYFNSAGDSGYLATYQFDVRSHIRTRINMHSYMSPLYCVGICICMYVYNKCKDSRIHSGPSP